MTAPLILPILRSGAGSSPLAGGCLMQLVAYLSDGRSWTDSPACVHPYLRAAAISVNDRVSDEARPALALLAPRFIGTAEFAEPGLDIRLAIWAAEHVLVPGRSDDDLAAILLRMTRSALAGRTHPASLRSAWRMLRAQYPPMLADYGIDTILLLPQRPPIIELAVSIAEAAVRPSTPVKISDAVHHMHVTGRSDEDRTAFMERMLDEFDRLTGRERREAAPAETARMSTMRRVLGTVTAW